MKPRCPEVLQTKKRPILILALCLQNIDNQYLLPAFLMKIAAHRFMKKPRRIISRQSIIQIL